MANFTAHGPAGRPLPRDWQAQAVAANDAFMANYQATVEQAWRSPLSSTAHSIIKSARLTGQQPPAPPRRNDARTDSRLDGAMRLVAEDDEMQLWRNENGTTVQIMKRKQ